MAFVSYDYNTLVSQKLATRDRVFALESCAPIEIHICMKVRETSVECGLKRELFRENGRPCCSLRTMQMVRGQIFTVVAHLPYRSDLASSDFRLSPNWKRRWKLNVFHPILKLVFAVRNWIKSKRETFFMDGIKKNG